MEKLLKSLCTVGELKALLKDVDDDNLLILRVDDIPLHVLKDELNMKHPFYSFLSSKKINVANYTNTTVIYGEYE